MLRHMPARVRLGAGAACLALLLGCAPLQPTAGVGAGRFEFALIGDQQYNAQSEAQFPRLMADVDRSNLAFVVHVGDFKAGTSMACSDELFRSRKEQFDASRHPFIYTPGDNEWTDCHTHYFRVDKPLFRKGEEAPGDRGRQVENFIRVESFGFPEAHWIRVIVDPNDPGVFAFKEEIVEANRFTR